MKASKRLCSTTGVHSCALCMTHCCWSSLGEGRRGEVGPTFTGDRVGKGGVGLLVGTSRFNTLNGVVWRRCFGCWPFMVCRFVSVLSGLAGGLLASYVSPHLLQGTASLRGPRDKEGRGSREVRVGQAGRGRAQCGERPMGAATDGGKGFKERTRVNGRRPLGAASFRRPSIQASCQPPPPPPCACMHGSNRLPW